MARRARADTAIAGRTIAPFPVPGDTSREAAERWKTLNLPKQGTTTIAPLPPPVRTAPPPAASPAPQGVPPQAGEVLPGPGDYVQVDELPEALTKVEHVYPDAARRTGARGIVQVQALVLRDGNVGDARIVQSIPELDQAALECVRQWRFRPARAAGQPVAVWVMVPLRFEP